MSCGGCRAASGPHWYELGEIKAILVTKEGCGRSWESHRVPHGCCTMEGEGKHKIPATHCQNKRKVTGALRIAVNMLWSSKYLY